MDLIFSQQWMHGQAQLLLFREGKKDREREREQVRVSERKGVIWVNAQMTAYTKFYYYLYRTYLRTSEFEVCLHARIYDAYTPG